MAKDRRWGRALRHASVLVASGALALGLGSVVSPALAAASTTTAAPAAYTCSSGTVPAGSYESLTISGTCDVNAGSVSVAQDLTVDSPGALFANYAGSDVAVSGNVVVDSGGVLVLGCEPKAFPCANSPSGVTDDTVGGSLSASDPLALVVHHASIAGDLNETGGGGGVSCAGPSAAFNNGKGHGYIDYEDDTIGGNATVSGIQACWSGMLRDRVGGSLTYSDNADADPDSNEVGTDVVGRDLACAGDSPAVQFGDSHAGPDIVSGEVSGQCTTVVASYWLAGADGGVFSFGPARFYGSMAGKKLNGPVVGIAPTPDGKGYWLVGSDGGVFSFGDAQFYGSMAGKKLNGPVVGIAPTPEGKGYWLVGSGGGVFSFGDAQFYGSMGGKKLNGPVEDLMATMDGKGYWLVGSDGGVFNFGDAAFFGSPGGKRLAAPVVDLAPAPGGMGYWLVGSDGGVFSFGEAPFLGSLGGKRLTAPVVDAASPMPMMPMMPMAG